MTLSCRKKGCLPHLSQGVRRTLRLLRYEFKIQRMHRASVKKTHALYHGKSDLRLNLGCGSHPKAGWVNIDLSQQADLNLDLRESLPFEDGSTSFIYSEHFFEHLEYPRQTTFFLKECFRVLAPNGRLSLGVPDSEWPIKAYSEDSKGYFELARTIFHPKWCNTRMHHLNFHFRQGNEHKYAYDEETLILILRKQGFQSVSRREFLSELDSSSRSVGTLYVEAKRPC